MNDQRRPRLQRRGSWWAVLLGGLVSAVLAAPATQPEPGPLAERVIIVANANQPDSLALAEAYADARGIPRGNIAALPMSGAEAVDWPTFTREIFNPLQAWLLAHHWLDAIPMDLHDEAGRRKLVVSGHRISFLVVCRGVPLRLVGSPGRPPDLPPTAPAQLRTAKAAVDSELTLLARSGSRRDGFLPNPLFQRPAPAAAELGAVVRVTRLDGPSATAARTLITQTLAAEERGLIGRAYVDLRGPHALGDRWLEATAEHLAREGWDVAVDRKPTTLQPGDRADAAAWYFGWYDSGISGPFAAPDFRFPAGAVALHLHSASAASLRHEDGGGWCGPLVSRGVSATFGNVHEPYLEYTHRPDLLVQSLTAGATLGEAAYEAMPVLSWQSVVIGDPLYRPFAVTPAAQWERRHRLSPAEAAHVVLREVRRLDLAGRGEAATRLLEAATREAPSLALVLAQARRWDAAGGPPAGRRALPFVRQIREVPATERGLVAELARTLGPGGESLALWTTLLAQAAPAEARRSWLREAAAAADAAGDRDLSRRWLGELEQLEQAAPR